MLTCPDKLHIYTSFDDWGNKIQLEGNTQKLNHIVSVSGVQREAYVALCSGNCLQGTSEHLSTVLPKYDPLNPHGAFGFI